MKWVTKIRKFIPTIGSTDCEYNFSRRREENDEEINETKYFKYFNLQGEKKFIALGSY